MKTAFLEVTSFEGFRKDFVSSSFVQSSRVNQDYANKGGRPAPVKGLAACCGAFDERLGVATEASGCRCCLGGCASQCPSHDRLLLQDDDLPDIECTVHNGFSTLLRAEKKNICKSESSDGN